MTNAELADRLDKLERDVKKLQKTAGAVTVTAAPTIRPPAQSAGAAVSYAQDGYADDGVQRRWIGTHPGNLDEAKAFVAKSTGEGWNSPTVFEVFVLTDLVPTPEERAASAASGGGLSDTFARWDANEAEGKAYSTEGWWNEVLRRRQASSGTPGGGASGDRGGDPQPTGGKTGGGN